MQSLLLPLVGAGVTLVAVSLLLPVHARLSDRHLQRSLPPDQVTRDSLCATFLKVRLDHGEGKHA